VLAKLAYLTLCRSVQLLTQLARGDAANDPRSSSCATSSSSCAARRPRPRLEPADRALLAAISRVLSRIR
jgi:putative transposase